MRASLLGMYLVQAVAFGAKRLAQRRGVALRSTAYDALTKELREVARLEEVSGILSYDEQCFMSEGSAASRAAQKEALAGVIHEKRTSARMAEVIDAARGLKLDDARENANVRDAIEGFDVGAIKTGMLWKASLIEVVAARVAELEASLSKFEPSIKRRKRRANDAA